MKRLIILIIVLMIVPMGLIYSQRNLNKNLLRQADITIDDHGVRYSTVIRIGFNKRVFDIAKGINEINFDDLEETNIQTTFKFIHDKYGDFSITKTFPNAIWGDTVTYSHILNKHVKIIDVSQRLTLKFKFSVPIDTIIDYLSKQKFVEYATGPWEIRLIAEPNDQYFQSSRWAFDKANLVQAWDITKSNNSIKVGIADYFTDSITLLHDDLIDKIQFPSYWTNEYGGHGLYVCGIVGAKTNNTLGIAGIGWNSTVLAEDAWYINPYVAIENLRLRGADIINCSFIGSYDQDIAAAVHNCINAHIIVVAGSGNGVSECGFIPRVIYPAAYNFTEGQVIAITSSICYDGINETKVDNVNYSPGTNPVSDPTNAFVDFSAPGGNYTILSHLTYNGYLHNVNPGTYLASSFTAGIIALLKSINTGLTQNQVYTILKNTTDKIGTDSYQYDNNSWNQFLGYGRINAYKALKYTIEHYGGTFTQDVIIPAGDTWNLQPGITLKFNPGCALVVNGTLNVQGTSSNKVYFTRNVSIGNWVGVRFNNGSSGSIVYADIQYASSGIYFNSLGNNSCSVYNSYIQNCSSSGIHAVNSSLMIIQNNHILNNGSYGIYCNNYSNPYIYYNIIKGHNVAGIYTDYYSQPYASTNGGAGSNVIKENIGCGIYANYNSVPHFGNGTSYAYNSIYNNTSYEVKSENNSTVWVQYNYWGDGESFYGSTIYNGYDLGDDDPNEGRMRIADNNNDNLISHTVNLSVRNDNSTDISLSFEGDEDEELNKYLEIFKKEGNTPAGRYALIMIEECYSKLKKDGFEDFINKEIFSRKDAKDELIVMGYELINHGLLNKNDYKGVIKNLEKIKRELLLNEAIEKNTLFALGAIYLNIMNDKTQAGKYFEELETKYANDILTHNSQLLLGNNHDKELFKQETEPDKLEQEYLLSTINYPNPFNPTTTIIYSLPEAGNVQIKIFDVLGREVAELVDETKNAGKHTVTWNGSSNASGIYFYKITFDSKTLYKKMLMIK